jgi:hypothetical protein
MFTETTGSVPAVSRASNLRKMQSVSIIANNWQEDPGKPMMAWIFAD